MLFPGDPAPSESKNSYGTTNRIIKTVGELKTFDGRRFWINSKQARYTPLLDDLVLGVVRGKGKDHYKVDIGAPAYAVIDHLDFPNATKRNKISIEIGDVVFGQVVDDSPHSDVRISAKNEEIEGLGPMKDGALLKTGILQSRSYLLEPPDKINENCVLVFSMNGYCYATPPTSQVIREVLKLTQERP